MFLTFPVIEMKIWNWLNRLKERVIHFILIIKRSFHGNAKRFRVTIICKTLNWLHSRSKIQALSSLNFLWRRPLSYRNQSIDLQSTASVMKELKARAWLRHISISLYQATISNSILFFLTINKQNKRTNRDN